MSRNPRAIVVDDSALVRAALSAAIDDDDDIDLIAAASNAYKARDIIVRERPDVMSLDVKMPGIDGFSFLKQLMKFCPIRTVIVSSSEESDAAFRNRAISMGAVDALTKRKCERPSDLEHMARDVVALLKRAARSTFPVAEMPSGLRAETEYCEPRQRNGVVVAMGASTGGVAALAEILPTFSKDGPPIVVCQHIPEGFGAQFASRMGEICKMTVKLGDRGEFLRRGHIYIAASDDTHLIVARQNERLILRKERTEKVYFQRPAVDPLFHSVAEHVGASAIGVILTGIGEDGAAGLLSIKKSGGQTIVQDEESSTVYGMPAEAMRLGAAEKSVPLHLISRVVSGCIKKLEQNKGRRK